MVKYSYKMPTYVVGEKKLYIGTWKGGISFYGGNIPEDPMVGLLYEYPKLRTGRGTIQFKTGAADVIDDDLFMAFIKDSLNE